MKRLSWKYIAGLIDSEGCLDVQITNGVYVRPRIRVALAENAKFLLDILHTNHGGFLTKRSRNNQNPNWQDAYSWELVGYTTVEPFLRNFVNHLEIKQEQARLLLWMESNIKGKQVSEEVRQCIRDELKAMKRDPHRLSEKAQERILALL